MDNKSYQKKVEEEIYERTAPPAEIVHQAINNEGEHELRRNSSALAWSGLAAGLSMGFSLAAQGLLWAHLPDEPWRPLVANLGYTVGFLIVILGRQQLFTENTLTPILPLLKGTKQVTVSNVLRLWGIVLLSNLAGAMAFAAVVAKLGVLEPQVQKAMAEIGRGIMGHSFWVMLLRAVFAGWLIALMVWLLPAADSARIWVVIIISYLVGLGGFPHIIAGSTETFYLVMRGEEPLTGFFAGFILPTLLGNVLGGVALVAALAHAQVEMDKGKARR